MNLKLQSETFSDLEKIAKDVGSTPTGMMRLLAERFVAEVKSRGMVLPAEWLSKLPEADGRSGAEIKTSWYKKKSETTELNKKEKISAFPAQSRVAEEPASYGAQRFAIAMTGELAAGLHSGGTLDEPEVLELVRQYKPGWFARRVCGDSMAPDYPDGSTVILRPLEGAHPKSGADVMYVDGHTEALKRYRRRKGSHYLESINEDYPDVYPMEDDGRIVAVVEDVILNQV